MELKKTFLTAAAAAMLATAAQAAEAPKMEAKPKAKKDQKEKCYGVAKAGKNDCSWAGGDCHASLTKDADKTAWILMPKGLCERLVGGSLKSS